ncbi:hypothetical protein M9Y10_007620 [Tritrichomonas musculus]|uniref:Protein kinase domain-containing protein n=1 Tax=Tritrichomonas musculus TaxID=1915356 RepID=A0ABR2J2R1_9EUKA
MAQVEKYLISLDKYAIVSEIGRGSFGQVYIVENKETKQQYAAKVLQYDDEDYRENCLKSIEIMGELRHPTLVNLIGYSPVDFEGKSNITIILDLATNGSLHKWIKNGNYSATQKQIILVGICAGMKILHSHSYMHRDIKPDNILIDKDFHPCITDYLLMEKYEPGKKYQENVGTPAYMAPECFDTQDYGLLCDVYSFAILMYQVVTGNSKVYDAQKFKSIYHLVSLIRKGERPSFEVPVKSSIKELIEKCWSGEVSDRLTFNQLFEKLAYDPEYYLDGVDENQVKQYADSVKQ